MAKASKSKPRKPPKTRRRYSIGEWYGSAFETISPPEKHRSAQAEVEVNAIRGLECPFQIDAICNKKGGVCSLKLYEQTGAAPVVSSGPIVTTCPNRFLEQNVVFKWIGKTILNTDDPIILGQVGFLDRLKSDAEASKLQLAGGDGDDGEEEEDKRDFIGRIDNVLIHPASEPIEWCAVELQAVYFSGKSMRQEFGMMADLCWLEMPFPRAHRRPDWRSSGPKRLLPQLQTKVPTIAIWGKKMAVVIDEAFFGSLVGLEHEKYLSNAEIAWFVVRYAMNGNRWQLTPKEVVYSRLDSSVKALTGGVPLSKDRFEKQLREKFSVRQKK